jgi:hypothetical protein
LARIVICRSRKELARVTLRETDQLKDADEGLQEKECQFQQTDIDESPG